MNAFPGIAPRSPGIDSVTERGNSPILDRMKSLCATALRNFLVANLCAVVPLWAAVFGWLPDEVRVYMQKIGSQTVRVVADGAVLAEEYCGRWEKGHIWRFYLHDGMAWKDLAFRLPPGVGPDAVARIERRKWRLFRLSWTGRGLERVAQTDDEFAFGRPRPGRPGIVPEGPALALGILEALLLGINNFFGFFIFSSFFNNFQNFQSLNKSIFHIFDISIKRISRIINIFSFSFFTFRRIKTFLFRKSIKILRIIIIFNIRNERSFCISNIIPINSLKKRMFFNFLYSIIPQPIFWCSYHRFN